MWESKVEDIKLDLEKQASTVGKKISIKGIGCKDRISDYKYLRKFDAKIENVFTVEEGTNARPIYTKKIEKSVSLRCPLNVSFSFCVSS